MYRIFIVLVFLLFSYAKCWSAEPAMAAEAAKNEAVSEAFKEAVNAGSAAGNVTPAEEYKQRLSRVIVREKISPEEAPDEVDTLYRFMPKRAAKHQAGTITINEADIEYSRDFKVFAKLPVQLGLGTGYKGIQNTTAVELPANLTVMAFDAEVTLPFFGIENTYFRIGLTPSFMGENWKANSSNSHLFSRYFAIYQPNPKLTLIGGVAIFPGYEDTVAPIVGIIYQYNDRLLFNLTPKRPTVNYSVNDKLDIFLEGDFSGSEYQVKKDGYKKAVLQYNEIHSGLGMQYFINKYIDFSVSAGYMFSRSLEYRNVDGKVSIENGLYMDFRIEAMF